MAGVKGDFIHGMTQSHAMNNLFNTQFHAMNNLF